MSNYNADSLVHLDQRIHVQNRISLYLGNQPLDTALREIIDNGVDEVRAGHGSHVSLTLYADGSLEVEDNGRGIPTDINSTTGENGLIMALAKIGSGGKFGSDNYQGTSSMGLNGIGASATCVTSARMTATVYRGGKEHVMEFQNGIPGHFTNKDDKNPSVKDPFTETNDLIIRKDSRPASVRKENPSGTKIRYWSNPIFFPANDILRLDEIIERMRHTVFLVPQLSMTVNDYRDPENPQTTVYDYEGGIQEMLSLEAPDAPIHPLIYLNGHGSYSQTVQQVLNANEAKTVDVIREYNVEVALQWGEGYERVSRSFANTIHTPLGGVHVRAFEKSLVKVLIDKIKSTRGLLGTKEEDPTLDDILTGLTFVVSVTLPEPSFIGQDKQRLGGTIFGNGAEAIFTQELSAWVENKKNANDLKKILEKIVNESRTRVEARTRKAIARKKTELSGNASMPAKFLDCANPNEDFAELLICEGDSALGTIKAARDSRYQAVIPIRGKILNTQKSTFSASLANNEIADIAQVIGAGVGKDFDVDNMRFGKIILAADADVDGSHIAVLLMTMFKNILPGLVEAGKLYIATPPLFIVNEGTGAKAVKHYVENDEALQILLADLRKKGAKIGDIQRIKGLGEMNAEVFWETTLNPETRKLRSITADDIRWVDMMELAMGNSVEPRKDWIMRSRALLSDEDIDA